MFQLVHSAIVFCPFSMEAETVHRRLGGGAAHSNVVCRFWMRGKCNRNPCRFMHRESESPNVYRRTSKESNVLLEGQSMRRSSYCLGNSMAGSEAKTVQKSSNHDIKHLPRKRPNPINSLASATGGGVSEYKSIEESSSSSTSTDSGNIEEIGACSKCSDASEDKTVNKSSNKACDYWMSGSCINGDGCQFLHSWCRGDWFSLLANLKGHTEAVCGVAHPSGSDKLYSGSSDGTVHVWDCHTGQSTRVINLGDEIGSLISEGPWIFVGLPNVVKAWNIETAADYNLNGPVGQVYAMTVSSDTLFAGAQDGSILAWKGSTESPNPFELATSLKGHTGAVICLTIGRDRLYSASMDSTIRVWELDTLRCIHMLKGHADAVMSLICWDEYLLSCSLDRTIKVWAATEEGNIEVIYTHEKEHGAIALCGMHDAEDKPVLFCSCNDNSIYLYDLPSFNERGKIFSKGEVRTIEIGPSGLFFTGDGTGLLNVWKLAESHGRVLQVA
ncbi:zinc finger CCCH domain-containing protein 48-like isoform X1 [Hevea brasiliensis]|nr:zinc finger CCCH domain-containing protein 48-like isoform X1 [Hevea brasiliensis]